MTEKQCYAVLGVTKQATDDEIKKAYRIAAKKWHPDYNIGNEEAKQKFIEVSEAYQSILEFRNKKKARFSFKSIFVYPKDDIDEETEKPPVHIPQRGMDIHYNLDIKFEESVLGCKKVITIEKDKRCQCYEQDGHIDYACPQCHGSGKYRKKVLLEINVPKGISDGQTMKIKGRGNVGDVGAENGDVIITASVDKNKKYYQRGNDLYFKLEITFPEAVRGTTKQVPTLYGEVELTVPPGTQPRTKFCLEGKGIPKLDGSIGDEYVIVAVVVPIMYSTEESIEFLNEVQSKLYDENPLFKKYRSR